MTHVSVDDRTSMCSKYCCPGVRHGFSLLFVLHLFTIHFIEIRAEYFEGTAANTLSIFFLSSSCPVILHVFLSHIKVKEYITVWYHMQKENIVMSFGCLLWYSRARTLWMKLNDNECSRDRYLSKEMEPSLLSSLRENPLHSSLSLFFSTHVHDFVYPSSSFPFLLLMLLFVSRSFTQTSFTFLPLLVFRRRVFPR